MKVQQWVSRMMFEDHTNPYWPVFITPTYAVEPGSIEEIVEDWQRFTKRIRDNGYTCRYFVTVERGSKKGRLHLHAVLWSDLSALPYRRQRAVYEQCWKNGFCLLRIMYGGRAGFNYVSKYLLKDTLWYRWSARPGLGAKGKHAYLERGVTEYLKNRRLIYRVRVSVLGQEIVATAHSGWRKELRQMLGLRQDNKRNVFVDNVVDIESYSETLARVLNGKA